MRLDPFTRGYVEAALWTSTHEKDGRDDVPMDRDFSATDVAPETLEVMAAECRVFQETNRPLFGGRSSEAGHDFWMTRNGHGSGFWDGDWPSYEGNVLSEAARRAGGYTLFIGDDGLVHGMRG